jgi:hypothetical protein
MFQGLEQGVAVVDRAPYSRPVRTWPTVGVDARSRWLRTWRTVRLLLQRARPGFSHAVRQTHRLSLRTQHHVRPLSPGQEDLLIAIRQCHDMIVGLVFSSEPATTRVTRVVHKTEGLAPPAGMRDAVEHAR